MSLVEGDSQLAWETDLDGNGSEASGPEPASEGDKLALAGSENVSEDYVSVPMPGQRYTEACPPCWVEACPMLPEI